MAAETTPALVDRKDVVAVRSVRLAPAGDAAPLTFTFAYITIADDRLPHLRVAAGAIASSSAPQCGCDACDESLDGAARELEHFVLTVAERGFVEWIEPHRRWAGASFESPEGSMSGEGSIEHLDSLEVEAARARLGAPRREWAPWVRR